jgi:hypothetical protein
MKKILQRIALCVVVLVIAGIAAGVRYFTYDPTMSKEEDNGYVTDTQGMTYTMVADKEGSTYVVVTDKEGNRYAAEYDGTTVGSTVGNINGEVALGDVPTNYDGPHLEVSNDINKFQGEISTTVSNDVENEDITSTTAPNNAPTKGDDVTTTKPAKPDNKPTKPSQSGGKLEAYRIEKYQKIFESGTYLMKITTNDDSLGDAPVTMAIKNGNMYVDMAVDIDEKTTMDCGMLYLKGKDTMYLIFNDFKKYCKMPESMMGEDMNMEDMMSEMGASDIGKITVSEVEINGEKLILESYTSTLDGTTVNYYFQDDVLVRRDNVYSNGQVDSTFFAVLTTDVPDSYFEIPKGYGYLNLSLLDALV